MVQAKASIRLYFKNIAEPENLTKNLGSESEKHLRCTNCENVLGIKAVQKGKLVYRMRKGYFHRKLG